MNTRKQKGEKTCRNQITIFKRINFKTRVVNLSEFSSSLFFLFIQNNRNIVKIIKTNSKFFKNCPPNTTFFQVQYPVGCLPFLHMIKPPPQRGGYQ